MAAKTVSKKKTGQARSAPKRVAAAPAPTPMPASVAFLVWLFTALSIIFFAMAIYRYG